jgi:hypothetical protein
MAAHKNARRPAALNSCAHVAPGHFFKGFKEVRTLLNNSRFR